MKKVFFNTIQVAAFLLISTLSLKAQAVITEYFTMKEPFRIDLSDKKTVKAVYTKGVLDLDWNDAKRVLAVSYDPKLTRVEDVMRTIKEVAANQILNGSPAGISANASAKNERD